jgi:hypothetical protein
MNKTLTTIHNLIMQGNCKSKLFLAFKNSATLDEVKDEEKLVEKVKPHKDNKNTRGWY